MIDLSLCRFCGLTYIHSFIVYLYITSPTSHAALTMPQASHASRGMPRDPARSHPTASLIVSGSVPPSEQSVATQTHLFLRDTATPPPHQTSDPASDAASDHTRRLTLQQHPTPARRWQTGVSPISTRILIGAEPKDSEPNGLQRCISAIGGQSSPQPRNWSWSFRCCFCCYVVLTRAVDYQTSH